MICFQKLEKKRKKVKKKYCLILLLKELTLERTDIEFINIIILSFECFPARGILFS